MVIISWHHLRNQTDLGGKDPQLLSIPGNKVIKKDQVVIAQWLARQLATGVVPGSNPNMGDKLLISD